MSFSKPPPQQRYILWTLTQPLELTLRTLTLNFYRNTHTHWILILKIIEILGVRILMKMIHDGVGTQTNNISSVRTPCVCPGMGGGGMENHIDWYITCTVFSHISTPAPISVNSAPFCGSLYAEYTPLNKNGWNIQVSGNPLAGLNTVYNECGHMLDSVALFKTNSAIIHS